jgi:hypothetical protein
MTPQAPTPESIAAAKLAQQQERDRVFQITGYRIGDNGQIVKEQP